MAAFRPEERGIHVEVAAGDHQGVDALGVGLGAVDLEGQQHRQAARAHHRLPVVLAQRVPGQLRVAPGRFCIDRDADDGKARFGAGYAHVGTLEHYPARWNHLAG